MYYSLINKVGSKSEITGTNQSIQIALPSADNDAMLDDEENCEACKL
jgi:hypothetical protein